MLQNGFVEVAKLAYANETKESIPSRKLYSQYFWQIANSVFNKNKFAIVPQFKESVVFSSVSGKPKLFLEKIFMNSVIDDGGIYLPVFPSRTNIPVVVLKNCDPELSYKPADSSICV